MNKTFAAAAISLALAAPALSAPLTDYYDDMQQPRRDLAALKQELENCDAYRPLPPADTDTAQVREVLKQRSACYLEVGNRLIDKFYADDSAAVKSKIADYMQADSALNNTIFEKTDYCFPNCGTIAQDLSASAYNQDMLAVIRRLIDNLEHRFN